MIYITPGNQVSIIGQVLRPGRFSLDGVKMRLVDALAMAGGMVPSASDSVVVTGMRDGQPFKKNLMLQDFFYPMNLLKIYMSLRMTKSMCIVHPCTIFTVRYNVQAVIESNEI